MGATYVDFTLNRICNLSTNMCKLKKNRRVKPETIIKIAGIDYLYDDEYALSLDVKEVAKDSNTIHGKIYSRVHGDSWRITGEVIEDHFAWVGYFEAEHPKFGDVWGNFDDKVYADSEDAFKNFYKKHKPYSWNPEEI
jgi:hypothetical protein